MRILGWPAFRGRDRNPYTWLLYRHMQAEVEDFTFRRALRAARFSVLHMHWPEIFLNEHGALQAAVRCCALLSLMDYVRLRGVKTVWTVHNLASHERRHARQETWFWDELTHRLDGYIALSCSGLHAARERFAALAHIPGRIVRHGHYRDEYPIDTSTNARGRLGIGEDKRVLLAFGHIRAYKNFPLLIELFKQVEDDNLVLLIAGRPATPSIASDLLTKAVSDNRIRLHLEHIPREAVSLYFQAADLVVLPYREIWNSGTALLALSLNRPVLLPNKGAMAELAADAGQEWVQTYTGDMTALTLRQALQWLSVTTRPATAPLHGLDWTNLARETLDFYRELNGRSCDRYAE